MSELDGASPQEMEEFKDKYVDTHTEIKGMSLFDSLITGRKKGSLLGKQPGDKNAGNYKLLKKPIERECIEKQEEANRGFIMDAFEIRRREILNKKDYPIKELVNAVIKLMPQRTEAKVEHDMSFADMVKSVHLERKHYKAIDAEDEDGK